MAPGRSLYNDINEIMAKDHIVEGPGKEYSIGRRASKAAGIVLLVTALASPFVSCGTPTYRTQEPVSRDRTHIQKEKTPFIKYLIGAVVSIGVSLGASYLVCQALPDKPVPIPEPVPETVSDEPWHGGGHGD